MGVEGNKRRVRICLTAGSASARDGSHGMLLSDLSAT